MTGLRLLADDLTGALDSGCAFATPDRPVQVAVPGRPLPDGPRLAVSTESRDMPELQAVASVLAVLKAMDCADPTVVWFKKIDSVMRGHPFAETKATLATGGFSHCIFAPAYPDLGRITIGTQQFLTAPSGARQPVGCDFRDAFGLPEQPSVVEPKMITFIEADSQDLLQRRVLTVASAARGKVLWVGTGGLAKALAPARGPTSPFPPICGVIVGTSHPSTRDQVSAALAAGAVLPVDDMQDDSRTDAKPWLLSPGLTAASAKETADVLRRQLATVTFEDTASRSLLVTGGDTLSIVLDVTGAQSLECVGDAATGVPVSRICGGRWHGVTLLSKSGGFGDVTLISRLVSSPCARSRR